MTTPPLLEPVRDVFRSVATSVVPECAEFLPSDWEEFETIVERALRDRPESLRKQFVVFLRAIELLPLARHARRFTRLNNLKQRRLLTALQNSRAFILRRGFWGLRTLIFMGYYARPAAAASIGYRARAEGWAARRQPNEVERSV